MQLTKLNTVAERRRDENQDLRVLKMFEDQIKGIATLLTEIKEKCAEFVTTDTAKAEYERLIEYDMRVFVILSRMKSGSENREQTIQIEEAVESQLGRVCTQRRSWCSYRSLR